MSEIIDIINMIVGIAGLLLACFVAFVLDHHFDFRHMVKESFTKKCLIGLSNAQCYATVSEGKSKISLKSAGRERLRVNLHLEKENNGNRVGVACNDLQFNSWIGLVRKHSKLYAVCTLDRGYDGCADVQFEFEDAKYNKIYSEVSRLIAGKNEIVIDLDSLVYNRDKWRDIAKVCFVLLPESSDPYDGEVCIEGLTVEE